MKQFKLIKTYPGSLSLNSVVSIEPEQETGYYSENKEYWQEVKEEVKKEYEILQIKNKFNGNIITFNSKGEPIHRTDGCTIACTLNLKSCLNTKSIDIFQIKRLSDSEIFTIGDKVKGDYESVITGFKIDELSKSRITVYTNSLICPYYNNCCLSYIKKAPIALFTTLDGKEIFEGNTVYCVDLNLLPNLRLERITHIKKEDLNIFKNVNVYFSETKAEEFILLNKPVLSINDLEKIDLYPNESNRIQIDKCKLKELVKSKL